MRATGSSASKMAAMAPRSSLLIPNCRGRSSRGSSTHSSRHPPSSTQRFTRRKTAASEFWAVVTQRTAADATRQYRDARKRDPKAFLFPESILNQLAYTRLQEGRADDAVELFKLIVEAYPTSANAQDSLADAYASRGQNDLAISAEQKCLDLLPGDSINDEFKAYLRQSAERKIAKLKAGS